LQAESLINIDNADIFFTPLVSLIPIQKEVLEFICQVSEAFVFEYIFHKKNEDIGVAFGVSNLQLGKHSAIQISHKLMYKL